MAAASRKITPWREPALQSWINRFAFQGKHAENTLVNPAQWFALDEPLYAFDSERKFAEGKRTLRAQSTRAQPF